MQRLASFPFFFFFNSPSLAIYICPLSLFPLILFPPPTPGFFVVLLLVPRAIEEKDCIRIAHVYAAVAFCCSRSPRDTFQRRWQVLLNLVVAEKDTMPRRRVRPRALIVAITPLRSSKIRPTYLRFLSFVSGFGNDRRESFERKTMESDIEDTVRKEFFFEHFPESREVSSVDEISGWECIRVHDQI